MFPPDSVPDEDTRDISATVSFGVMGGQEPIRLMNIVERSLWADAVIEKRQQLVEWVSTLHPQKLACRIDQEFFHGAYNHGQKVTFLDGTKWLVRFPISGHVSAQYADEKVATEVMVMRLIAEKTTIPVPEIKHWGSAAENPLGLGPFIIMDFIDGVPLESLLSNPAAEQDFRLISEDIRDGMLEVLYKQFARFLLQLFQLNFDCIGSLPRMRTEFHAPIRPLTLKVHDILHTGGVNTFGDRNHGFSTTTEYFQYVIEQDWQQLVEQPNSVGGEGDARMMFESFSALKALVPGLIHPQYDGGQFKLICDDLSLANVIVRSKDDFTIVGLIDFEWSYIGPAQLFGSAPWWLLGVRLNHLCACHEKDYPAMADRFSKYLEMFQRILEEEEGKMLGHQGRELSRLVRWSEASGAMWLHMLLSCGFNRPESFPFVQLQHHIGTERWKHMKRQFRGTETAFVKEKLTQLEQYETDEEWASELEDEFDSGRLTREQYIEALIVL